MPLLSLKHWKISLAWVSILSLFLTCRPVFAEITVYESFSSTNPSKIELIGKSPGEQLGASIATGDFNGDGIDDVIIGSPFSSIGRREWNGKVSVVFGKAKSKVKKVDFANSNPDIVFYGERAGDQLGTSVAAGDYNNDGIDDLIIGAYNASYGSARPGKVYVVFGRLTWDGQPIDFFIENPDLKLVGGALDSGFGLTLSTADINNDDIDDILIGAPFSSSETVDKSGIVYAFFGEKNPVSMGVYMSDMADVIFYGQDSNERFGSAIASGHIINDDFNDIVISAYTANDGEKNQVGKVYIFKGLSKPLKKLRSPVFTFVGENVNEWAGYAIAVDDLNGDGIDDVAISSFPYNGLRYLGKISVFYSKKSFTRGSEIVVKNDNANIVIEEPNDEAIIGASILLDDFNSDGKSEIIIGAPGIGDPASTMPGDVYMIFDDGKSKRAFYSVNDEFATSTIHGENADDWFGYSIASLDFNGDGYKDLAIGSRYSDRIDSDNNGKVFIVFGNGGPVGKEKKVASPGDQKITRSEVLHEVIERLDLKAKKADFIANCYEYKEFCLFNFIAMSLYNDIKLEPKPILYPDISENSKYYEDIVIGTMLGLVNGMVSEKNTPFRPNDPISRINALKIVLGAADLVKPMYRFELAKELGSYENLVTQPSYFEDVDPKITYMWEYPRYTNFAVENGIIKKADRFRPTDKITVKELNSIITNTLKYLKSQDEETKSQ
jgi:hypothetical protein